jgi:hypothetical protein
VPVQQAPPFVVRGLPSCRRWLQASCSSGEGRAPPHMVCAAGAPLHLRQLRR